MYVCGHVCVCVCVCVYGVEDKQGEGECWITMKVM